MTQVVPVPVTKAKKGESIRGVADAIGTRVAIHYGAKDLSPTARMMYRGAAQNVVRRAEELHPYFAAVPDKAAQGVAIRAAQGLVPFETVSDPAVLALAGKVKTSFESLLKSSGLTENAARGNSVGLRSGMVMDDLNEMLSHYQSKFRFTNEAVKSPLGRTIDYGKGTDWMKSWEHWNPVPWRLQSHFHGSHSRASSGTHGSRGGRHCQRNADRSS